MTQHQEPYSLDIARRAVERFNPLTSEDADLLHRDLRLYGICITDDDGRRIDPLGYYRSTKERTHGPESAIDD